MENLKKKFHDIITKEYYNSFDEGWHTELDIEKISTECVEICKNFTKNCMVLANETDAMGRLELFIDKQINKNL